MKTAYTPKRYYGEEAERVTWRDCQAANLTIAKLNAGQIRIEDVMVEAPAQVRAILLEE